MLAGYTEAEVAGLGDLSELRVEQIRDLLHSKKIEAMKRGVVCISVWGVAEGDTYAVKPEGVGDTHMVEVTYVDKENKQIHILDTYLPLEKILPNNYNPDFGMVRYVEKKLSSEQKKTIISVFNSLLQFDLLTFFANFIKQFISVKETPPAIRSYRYPGDW